MGQVGLDALPWLLALGVATAMLLQVGTPALDIARYTAYWSLGVTLPGLLVARATLGTRGNLPEDIAIGAVTGLALELACFVLWSILGIQRLLWLWPLLVMVIFAAPGLRRHWRMTSPRPLPRLWSWWVASSIGIGAVVVRKSAFTAPLPPAGGRYYQDATWHLSIVHELTRSFPPQIPQLSGDVLRYHWFSHVHLAAAHLVSGAAEATVVLRLWIIPLLVVTALVGAALAMELSGRWWSGPIAAWGLLVFQGTNLLPTQGEAGVIFPDSPSQVYVLPLVLGISILLVRALRGLRLRAGWAVLALMLVTAAGAKPTALPVVLAGTVLAGLSLLVRRRREWLAALWVVLMVAVILPVSLLTLAGSDSRSKISLFDFVEFTLLYHRLTGVSQHPAAGPLLPEGTNDLSGRSLLILAILLLVPLIANIGRLVPFATFASSRLRKDPAAWFMAGQVLAGWGAYLVLFHPALSQVYFLRLANPVASVFGAWALAAAIPAAARTARWTALALAGGTLLGVSVVAIAGVVTPTLTADRQRSLSATVISFGAPLVFLFAAIGAGLVGWTLVRRRLPGLRGWGLGTVLAALVLGGPAYGAMAGTASALVDLVQNRAVPEGGQLLTPDAGVAMAWVERHIPEDAVVATNRHCVSGPERPQCLSVAFWVSGLGGRRTVIEGWGYTSEAASWSAPTPFPARLAANDAVFTDPSKRTIDRLRLDYGARWIVADTSAGPVSPELARFATTRFSRGTVTAYELR